MNFDLPTKSIIKGVAIVGLLIFLWLIREVIIILFAALIVSSATAPAVTWLKKRLRFPRALGALCVYFLVIAFLGGLFYAIIPPLVKELGQISLQLPQYFKDNNFFKENFANLNEWLTSDQGALAQLSQQLTQRFSSFFVGMARIFGGLVSIIMTLVISFYLSVQDEGIKRFLKTTVPPKNQAYVLDLIARSQKTLARWVKGQLISGTAVGIMIFLGLSILGVPYPFLLSLLAFALEIIPFLGPILAAIPAVILAFGISWVTGLFTIGLYLIVQQVENNLLCPLVMKKTVGLNPILVLTGLLIGGKLGGAVGVLLAVPTLA